MHGLEGRMARRKLRENVIVSTTPLMGDVLGVLTSSRRFRVSDVGATTSSNAEDIIREFQESAGKMGGNALSGLHFALVGGNTRGESPRAIGHLMGWATVVKMSRISAARSAIQRAPEETSRPLVDVDDEEDDDDGMVAPSESEEVWRTTPKTEETLKVQPAVRQVLKPPSRPQVVIPGPEDMVISGAKQKEAAHQDAAFGRSSSDESLLGIAEAVAAAVGDTRPEEENMSAKSWKVKTSEGKVYKAAPEVRLIQLLKAGRLSKDIHICEEGSSQWHPLADVKPFSSMA